MPELNGLEVIAEMGAERMPLTVFVTAYDEHAIRAFEANALDYLLKPFSDERFEMTMARVSIRMDERSVREFGRRILRMVSAAPARDLPLDRLVVKPEVQPASYGWPISTGSKLQAFMRTCTSEEKSCCTGPH
ncbi:MAG: hypothetical protein WA869_34370 [Alloacidobacterium sp.]|jgi:two-component system LytT family response regulator